ncbi:MAG: isochorismatase family cysteine hydrolase [Thermoprotei archaeon]
MVIVLVSVEVPEIRIVDSVNVDSTRAAVIVIDMQNDFVDPKGKLSVPTALKTVQNIKRLIENARNHNVPIIYTQDWHMKDDPEFRIWGEHAVANTWGAEIIDELKPHENDIVVKKLRYDAFYGTHLEHIISRVLKRDTLTIVGTVANICVLHTAGSAALRWFDVIVPVDGISALTEFDLHSALRQIDFLYKGKIIKSTDKITFI